MNLPQNVAELQRERVVMELEGIDRMYLNAYVPQLSTAIAHLREVLGDKTYESLARKAETMTTAAMATYAYDQIDQARTGLEHPS